MTELAPTRCPDCGGDVVEMLRYHAVGGWLPALWDADPSGTVMAWVWNDVAHAGRRSRRHRDAGVPTFSLHRCSRVVDVKDLQAAVSVYAGRKRPPAFTVKVRDRFEPGDRLTLREGGLRVRGTVRAVLVEVLPDWPAKQIEDAS